MASLDSLPGDQRAVLELVLRRGRSYEDIERLLSIDRGAVRARALAALDAIGPPAKIPTDQRGLIADYLLGQLPPEAHDEVKAGLARDADRREWARTLASELEPLAARALPEVPLEPEAPGTREEPIDGGAPAGREPPERPSSRLGGAILLGAGALVAVALVVFLIIQSGGSSHASGGDGHPGSRTQAQVSTPTTSNTSSSIVSCVPTQTTGTGKAKVVAQTLLIPPTGHGKAKGAAGVVTRGKSIVIEVAASGLAPNHHDAYAVWLFNSPTDYCRVGYYNPGVGRDGKLAALSPLPADASRYKYVLLALEPEPAPNQPTNVVLGGILKFHK